MLTHAFCHKLLLKSIPSFAVIKDCVPTAILTWPSYHKFFPIEELRILGCENTRAKLIIELVIYYVNLDRKNICIVKRKGEVLGLYTLKTNKMFFIQH